MKRTIFLAESQNHVRRALRLMLEQQAGLSVIGEADHSESLLAQVCQCPPDVILLDWKLPGLHPHRLLTALKQYCSGTFVLATGIWQEPEQALLDLGVDGFLSKQLPPDQFLHQLMQLLDQSTIKNEEEET